MRKTSCAVGVGCNDWLAGELHNQN